MSERLVRSYHTAIVSDDHVEILVEVELEESVAHEVLHADSQDAAGVLMQLK